MTMTWCNLYIFDKTIIIIQIFLSCCTEPWWLRGRSDAMFTQALLILRFGGPRVRSPWPESRIYDKLWIRNSFVCMAFRSRHEYPRFEWLQSENIGCMPSNCECKCKKAIYVPIDESLTCPLYGCWWFVGWYMYGMIKSSSLPVSAVGSNLGVSH